MTHEIGLNKSRCIQFSHKLCNNCVHFRQRQQPVVAVTSRRQPPPTQSYSPENLEKPKRKSTAGQAKKSSKIQRKKRKKKTAFAQSVTSLALGVRAEYELQAAVVSVLTSVMSATDCCSGGRPKHPLPEWWANGGDSSSQICLRRPQPPHHPLPKKGTAEAKAIALAALLTGKFSRRQDAGKAPNLMLRGRNLAHFSN